jgi:hypothetical protein
MRGLMDWIANLPPKQSDDYDLEAYVAKYGQPDSSKHLTLKTSAQNSQHSTRLRKTAPTFSQAYWQALP